MQFGKTTSNQVEQRNSKKRGIHQITKDPESLKNKSQDIKEANSLGKEMLKQGGSSFPAKRRKLLNEKYAQNAKSSAIQRNPFQSIELGINTKQKDEMLGGAHGSDLQQKSLEIDHSVPTKKNQSKTNAKLEKTRPSLHQSVAKSGKNYAKKQCNVTVAEIRPQDLFVDKESPSKSRRSVSQESSCRGELALDFNFSELSCGNIKSDQASIADWVDLFEKNQSIIKPETDENFFNLVNTEHLKQQEGVDEPQEEESRLGELDKAFICEHSEILKASKPLDQDASLVTPTKARIAQHTFSLVEMMERGERGLGRKTQTAAKPKFGQI